MAPDIKAAIAAISFQYALPSNLVRAICQVESNFEPYAFRYEPQYKWLVGDKLTMTVTEKFGQMCSWGLMQVMGGVAREYHFTGPLPALCEPAIGLNYGCRHLKKFFEQHGNWEDAVASYNAGSPRKVAGVFLNQDYVKKVMAAWSHWDTTTQKEA